MKNFLLLLPMIISVQLIAQSTYYITSLDSTKLYVQEFGSGEPVIILAGGPGLNAEYMKLIWENLSGKYRCIVLDQRGTGKSKLEHADSINMSINNYVDDLEALRNYLKIDQLILIGHSWGGLLTMQYVSTHPQHVKKLILLDPEGPTDKSSAYFSDNLMMRLHDEDFKEMAELNSMNKNMLKGYWPGFFYDRNRALATKSTIDFDSLLGEYPQTPMYVYPSIIASQDERIKLLEKFRGPVDIIQGRQDPIGESTAFEIKELMPQTHIYLIEKCGHLPWLENQEQVQYFFSTLNDCLK